MGADDGVHVLDDALHGCDAPATSRVLAAAIERLAPDLVLTGMASTDGTMGVVPAMLAERLGLPQVTYAERLTVEGSTVRSERDGDSQAETIEATLPALVSVTDQRTSRATPPSRGSWRRRRSRCRPGAWPTSASPPSEVGLAAAWTAVSSVSRPAPAPARDRSCPTRATAARSWPSSSPTAKLV